MVICNRADEFQACEECDHRLPHEPRQNEYWDCLVPDICFADGGPNTPITVCCLDARVEEK